VFGKPFRHNLQIALVRLIEKIGVLLHRRLAYWSLATDGQPQFVGLRIDEKLHELAGRFLVLAAGPDPDRPTVDHARRVAFAVRTREERQLDCLAVKRSVALQAWNPDAGSDHHGIATGLELVIDVFHGGGY